jgi:cell division septation protein DedD
MAAATKLLALVTVSALGGLGWLAYERITAVDPSAPRLIRADDGPIKIRPEDPGGMAVPDQDKLIYQSLNGGLVEETVERLLPPPEEPLPPPEPPEPEIVEQAPATTPAAAPAARSSTMPSLPPAEIDAQAEAAATAAPARPEAQHPPAPPEPAEVTAAPAPPEPAEVASTATLAPPPANSGPYMVQLASFRSIDAADKAWRRAVKKNGDLLSAHFARVVRADLGAGKGIYFRLRVGPFAKGEQAKSLCAKLKARSVDCIVVRP